MKSGVIIIALFCIFFLLPLHHMYAVIEEQSAHQLAKKYQLLPPLLAAIIANDYEKTASLLAAGEDPNLFHYASNILLIPLHEAIKQANISLVECLLSYGADYEERNEFNEMAIDLAKKELAILQFIKLPSEAIKSITYQQIIELLQTKQCNG